MVVGYTLITEDEKDALEIRPGFSLRDEKIRWILGILCMITGILKLLSPTEGDVLILGDLVPAAIGFVAGLILVLENYRNRSTRESKENANFDKALMRNKKIIGFVAIAIAAVHFLFPKVLFL
jgi:hypothetical protein